MFLTKQRLRYAFVAASALYVAALFFLAVAPVSSLVVGIPSDKLAHFLEFFVLGVLLLTTLSLFEARERDLLGFIIVSCIVLLSEVVQLFVLARSFSVLDMVAGLSGFAVGFGAFHLGRYSWMYFKR